MEYFKLKTISNLDYEDIMKFSSLKTKNHLLLKNAKAGKQPLDTIIIGVIKQNSKLPKIINYKGSPRNRFFLSEVLRNKEVAQEFQVILTGFYAVKVEAALENIKSDCWFIFSNATFYNYNGCRSDVAHLSLRLEESDAIERPLLTMIHQSQSPKKCIQDNLIEYVPINSVCIKQKHNIFAVVEVVLKQAVILSNGNRHTLLILVDPSCKESDAVRNSLPTHIFFNDPKEIFLEPIVEGDILRIRDAFMEFYPKENRVFGKIFSCNAITKFKSVEKNEEVTPITTYTQYILTEQDKRKVHELRKWWSEILKQKNLYNLEIEEECTHNEKTITEITKPTIFTLICQVIAVRQISSYKKFVLLRVTDGTVSKVLVNTVSLPEATQDLLSPDNNAVRGAKDIDIAIFDQINVAERIQVNDFVKLQNVSAVDLNSENVSSETQDTILDFHMANENCQVIKLPLTHFKVQQIIKRIKSQAEPEPDDSDSSSDPIISLARNLRNPDNIFTSKQIREEEIGIGPSLSSVRNKRCRLENEPNSNMADAFETIQPQSTTLNKDNSIESPSTLNNLNSKCKHNFQNSVMPSIVDNESHPIGSAHGFDSLLVNLSNGSSSNALISNSFKKSSNDMSNAGYTRQKNGTENEIYNSNSTKGICLHSEELPVSSSSEINRKSNPDQNELEDVVVGEAFKITTLSTGLPNLRYPKTPNRLEALDSPTPFDVTSTPVSRQNQSILYDGFSTNLNLRTRETTSHSIESGSPNEHEDPAVETSKVGKKIVYRFGQLRTLDQVVVLMDPPANLKSLTQMALSCKVGDTWQSYVLLEEILTCSENPCIECLEVDESLCCHDFVWGMCNKGLHQIQSSDLRKRYSKEALLKSSLLRCITCPSPMVDATDGNISSPNDVLTAEFSVEPFIKLELKLRDVTNDEVINVHLLGENAEKFFGVKPSFSWIVPSCNTRLTYKIFCLENMGQMPIKMGFKCVMYSDKKSIQVYGTSIMT